MSKPLSGVTVIDLTQIYNGPYATFLIAAAGAEIIKIEPPGGEHLRKRGVVGGAALPFAMLNGNKRSMVLNLKTDEGRDVLRDLVRKADVLVENFAPGAMQRLGLHFEALREINPRLIYAASSGYGSTGPNRDYPAMDLTVQAMAGIMAITGFPDRPPVKAGPAICDFFAGTHLYGAIVTALFDRTRTGIGRRVEVAMIDAVYASLSSALGLYFGTQGNVSERTGNRHAGLAEAPYNVYPTKDGWIAIICVGEIHWRSLCDAMQRPDLREDPRFTTLKERVANMDLVDQIVGDWTKNFDKEELFALLMRHRVACAPVRTLGEVMADESMHARGALQWQDHPQLGRIVVQQSPLRFDDMTVEQLEPSHALGEDTDAILRDKLGLSTADIAALRDARAVI